MVRKTCWTNTSRACAIATCVLAVAGCATVYGTAPTGQLAVADAAFSDATGAGASQYATTDYRNAQRKLDRAHDARNAGDYDAARNLAEEAAADAKLAATRARTVKAERAAAEVQAGIRALRDEIARTTP